MFLDMLSSSTAVTIGQTNASTLVSNVQTFVGPILLLVIGIVAIKHLMTRQMTQFFQFIALAVLVLLLFYTPGVLLAIVNLVNSFFGNSTSVTPGGGTQLVPTVTIQ